MPILYLILGHLIADFVLQPAHLVHWKKRHITGILTHSLIHLLVYLLVLFPYIQNKWTLIMIFAVSIIHLVIDQIKVKTKGGRKKHFILDQLAHLIVLIPAGYLIMQLSIQNVPQYYQNPWPAKILIILILVTYVRKIYLLQK